MSSQPNMAALVVVAGRIVRQFTNAPTDDEALLVELERILFEPKDLLGCYLDKIISEDELVNGVAANLVSYALAARPTIDRPANQIPSPELMATLRSVLLDTE